MFPSPGNTSYNPLISSATTVALNGAQIYARLDADNSSKWFLLEVLHYLKKHPEFAEALKLGLDAHDVYEGTAKAIVAGRYTGILNRRIFDYRLNGGAMVLGVFIDRFAVLADKRGIALNKIALDLARVATDIGQAGVGAVTFETGWGVLFLAISVLATFRDSYSLAKDFRPQRG